MPQENHSSSSGTNKNSNSNSHNKTKQNKGHKPAHQNTFAYRHNPKSKRTEQILSSPNVGLCRRCHDKIEWRKKYRKYKPLTQPSKCNMCQKKNVTAAYHTICDSCAIHPPVAVQSMTLTSPSPTMDLQQEPQPNRRIPICAMCVKEPALSTSSMSMAAITSLSSSSSTQGGQHVTMKDHIQAKEETLGRPLKLREIKALERKVLKLMLQEKERVKGERVSRQNEHDSEERRIREEGDHDDDDDDDSEEEDDDFSDSEDADDSEANDNDVKESEENAPIHEDVSFGSFHDEEDEDDPFLKAVGGAHKLLVGDAYRQMILEKERLTKMQSVQQGDAN